MSKQTLHLCNYSITTNYDRYFQLLSTDDAIVFYGSELSEQDYKTLSTNSLVLSKHVYFIIDNNVNNLPSIDYLYWVKLVDEYQRTFTWK